MNTIQIFALICFMPLFCMAETIILTPEQAVDIAMRNNKILRASEWTLKEKLEAEKEAVAGFLPKLSGNASYRRASHIPSFDFGSGTRTLDPPSLGLTPYDMMDTNVQKTLKIVGGMFSGMSEGMDMGSKDNYDLGFQLVQPVFAGFKIINGYRAVKAGKEIQRFGDEKTRQITAYTALSLYWLTYTMEKSLSVAEDAKAQLAKLQKDMQNMYEQKMIAEHELLQIKAAYAKSKVGVIQTRNQHRTVMRNLGNFLNLAPDAELRLEPGEKQNTEIQFKSLEDYLLSVRKERPDIRQQKKTEEAMELSEKIAKSGYMPAVSLAGSYTYAKPNQQVNFENEWASSWSIMALLNWNLWDWGAAFRQGRQAEYRRRAAQAQLEYAERTAITQAMDAWDAVESSKEEYEAAKESMTASELSYQASKLKHDQGLEKTSDLLSAQTSLTQARMDEIRAHIKLILALENLRIGGLGSTGQDSKKE